MVFSNLSVLAGLKNTEKIKLFKLKCILEK